MPFESALKNALSIWQMNSNENMSLIGAVKIGVSLDSSEYESSRIRGGNAQVAIFEGGYIRLEISANKLKEFHENNAMSFNIRLKDLSGRWNIPFFSCDKSDDTQSIILNGIDGMQKPQLDVLGNNEIPQATDFFHIFTEEGNSKRLTGSTSLIEYQWCTSPNPEVIEYSNKKRTSDKIKDDACKGILKLNAPVAMFGKTDWHDIIFRFSESHLELFVDGVLMDEEWSYGSHLGFKSPFLLCAGWIDGQLKTGFQGCVDHIALWNRALSDDEINKLCGGDTHVMQREYEILGAEKTVPNYWRPRGYNTYAGDVMLLWDNSRPENDRFHLFYLFDRRHHTSKWNLGAHQYAHMSSTDLYHWEHHPMALPIEHTWECAMGTGDFIYHEGQYNVFFTDCGGRCQFQDKPHQGSGVFRATSVDGIKYKKNYAPVIPTTDNDCADNSIFKDPATGLFHLLAQEKLKDGIRNISHYISKDLNRWSRQKKPFIEGKFGPCPHLFFWNDWYYFAIANTLYKSISISGPWDQLKPDPLIQLFFPKTAPFKNNRFLTAGWLPHLGWGGDLVFRELIQYKDGSLGTKFVQEMMPAKGESFHLNPRTLKGNIDWNGKKIRLFSTSKKSSSEVSVIKNTKIENLSLSMKVQTFCDRWSIDLLDDRGHRIMVKFDRISRMVSLNGPLDFWPNKERRSSSIFPLSFLDRLFKIEMLLKDGIIDICLDGQHTLIGRFMCFQGNQLSFSIENGEVTFSEIILRPIIT